MGSSQSCWSWQGLWKWAALAQGLGLTLAEGESSCALPRCCIKEAREQLWSELWGAEQPACLISPPAAPLPLVAAGTASRLAPVLTRVTVLATGAGTSTASAVLWAPCHGPAVGMWPHCGCVTLQGALPHGGWVQWGQLWPTIPGQALQLTYAALAVPGMGGRKRVDRWVEGAPSPEIISKYLFCAKQRECPQELVSMATTNVRFHVVNNRFHDNTSFTLGAGSWSDSLLGEGTGRCPQVLNPPLPPSHPLLALSPSIPGGVRAHAGV